MATKKKFEIWTVASLALLAMFAIFLLWPLVGLLKQSVYTSDGQMSLANFEKFFTYVNGYYLKPIWNSLKVTVCSTTVSLLLGILLNAADMHRWSVVSMILYVCMGWCILLGSF